MREITDATFDTDVMERSKTVPIVVDLWAPWCGPCQKLGPILERVIDETDGVEGVKVNIDENPSVSQSFEVQSIPAVYAVKDATVVDGFLGAQGEPAVRDFVSRLVPTPEETEVDRLLAQGDEHSLREALVLDPDHEKATVALAALLAESDRGDEALELLERVPESGEGRRVAALARTGGANGSDDVDTKLEGLLGLVKDDEAARQEFVDLLELLGADDPRTAEWRRRLSAALF